VSLYNEMLAEFQELAQRLWAFLLMDRGACRVFPRSQVAFSSPCDSWRVSASRVIKKDEEFFNFGRRDGELNWNG